jgi:hypothetical protein
MKKRFLLLIAIVSLMIASTACANVLTDPGFEDNPSTAWGTVGTAFTFNPDSAAAAYTGSEGLEVGVISGGWAEAYAYQQVTPVVPDDVFDASVWAKTNAASYWGIKLQASFRNDSWGVIDTIESSELQGTTDWTQLTVSGVAPADTAFATYKLYASRWGTEQSGTAYFDDASATVTPIPEPSSLMLLGGGLTGLFAMIPRRKK